MKTVSSWIRGLGTFALLAVTCISCGQSSNAAGTGIEGTITISPSHPGPTRVDEPNAAPLKNISFAVENETGAIADFTTDDVGKFRVSLKPGHYKISVKGANRIRRCGPFEVDVAAGRMTNVQWQCDSGMR
jgi:hypothetical protein